MTVVATDYDIRLAISELFRTEKFAKLHHDTAQQRKQREDDLRLRFKDRMPRPRYITTYFNARSEELKLSLQAKCAARSKSCLVDVTIELLDPLMADLMPAPHELVFVLYNDQSPTRPPTRLRTELRDGCLATSFWVHPDQLRGTLLEIEWTNETDAS